MLGLNFWPLKYDIYYDLPRFSAHDLPRPQKSIIAWKSLFVPSFQEYPETHEIKKNKGLKTQTVIK